MKTLYYDCFAGISGDMNLSALVDLGVSVSALESELAKLNLEGWHLEISQASRCGICGTQVKVHCHDTHEEHHHHCGLDVHCETAQHKHQHTHTHTHGRNFAEITEIIKKSTLSQRVKNDSIRIFKALAEAEAIIHGKTPEEVHFHEVGALDSIIDIIGAAICFELLDIDKIVASAVELGSGTVKCQHGVMPVPAPATAILAKKFPFTLGGAPHECTTPTGAAILATMCTEFCPKLSGKMLASGIGVGQRDCKELANVLRVMIIEESDVATSEMQKEELLELHANLDDMSPEAIAVLCEKLFEAGALDVWQEAIVMKKNRLATKVCVLCSSENRDKLESVIFKNSTTLGIRAVAVSRVSIPRNFVEFDSSFGNVKLKISGNGDNLHIKPEADDIKVISKQKGLSFTEVSAKIIDEFKSKKS